MPVELFKVKKSKGVRQRRRRRRQQPHILGRYKKREVATKKKHTKRRTFATAL